MTSAPQDQARPIAPVNPASPARSAPSAPPATPNPARPRARGEFADLLRSRRDRLTPADVGLPEGSRRRTAGLRREEVAQLAGVSTTYYTFLEQGRDVRPSPQVLTALAAALRLSAAERAHPFELAGVSSPAGPEAHAESVPPALATMVTRLDPYPAYLKGRRWDVLAANRAARALFADWRSRRPDDRNLLWWMFTDPAARKVYVDWVQEASAMLARFRAAAARRPGDPDFTGLIDRLHQASPEVRNWWPRHDVLPVASGTKQLHHPALGDVTFEHTVLQVAEHPDQTLVYFTTSSVPESRLAALAATLPVP
jgi:transcriptional regulator with XRE-family HTH domain